MKRGLVFTIVLFLVIGSILVFFYDSFDTGLTGRAIGEVVECVSPSDVGNLQCHPTNERKFQECVENDRTIRGRYFRWFFRNADLNVLWVNHNCAPGLGCGGQGECVAPSTCEILSVDWITPSSTVTEGDIVELNVGGSNCDTETLSFRIFESEPFGFGDDLITTLSGSFVGDSASVSWTTKWTDDGVGQGDPEYFFRATLESDRSEKANSGMINVQKLVIPPECGDGVIETPEVCEVGDTQECTDGEYTGSQDCSLDCSGFNLCVSGSCGDGELNGPETCDDGNVLNEDGCSSVCLIEVASGGSDGEGTGGEGTVDGEGSEDNGGGLESGQFLMDVGDSIQILINVGSQISVTYEELRDSLVLVKVLEITTNATTNETETRTITVNDIGEGNINVNVE